MSIREILFIILMVSLCVTALFRPRIGLYGYIWYAVVGPDIICWVEGKYPFSFALAVATLIGSMRYATRIPQVFKLPAVRWFLLLQIPLALSAIFSEGPFLAPDRYFIFEKITVMVLLVPLLVQTQRDVRDFLITLALCELFLGFRFGTFGIVHGGVLLVQAYGGLYDNNQLALAIVILIPSCWYCRYLVPQRWAKLGLLGILVSSMAAVIMTNSRGCSLALGVTVLWVVYHSKHKVAVLVLLALAVGPGLYLARNQYLKRMETIDMTNAQAASSGRIELWKMAISVWKAHPVLGVGLGGRNFAALSTQYLGEANVHVAHNSYLQMAADSGTFALLIYCTLIFSPIIGLQKAIRKMAGRDLVTLAIPMALEASLIAFAVGSTFYTENLYDLPYFLIMAAAVWLRAHKDQVLAPPGEALLGQEAGAPEAIPA